MVWGWEVSEIQGFMGDRGEMGWKGGKLTVATEV